MLKDRREKTTGFKQTARGGGTPSAWLQSSGFVFHCHTVVSYDNSIIRLMSCSPSNTLIQHVLHNALNSFSPPVQCVLPLKETQLPIPFCCCHLGRNRGKEGHYYTRCLCLQRVNINPLHCQLRHTAHLLLCLITNAIALGTEQTYSSQFLSFAALPLQDPSSNTMCKGGI